MESTNDNQIADIQMTDVKEDNERSTLFKYYSKDNIIKYGDIVIAYVVSCIWNYFVQKFTFYIFNTILTHLHIYNSNKDTTIYVFF